MKATQESINDIRHILESGKPKVKRIVLEQLATLQLTQTDFMTTPPPSWVLAADDLELRAILFAVQDM